MTSNAPTSRKRRTRRQAEPEATTPVRRPDTSVDAADDGNTGVDRSAVIGAGLKAMAIWSLQLIIVGIALFLGLWLLGRIWVGVLPIILALIVCTVLWPPVAWMRRHGVAPALAAVIALLGSFLLVAGVLAAIAPSIVDQATELADRASDGLQQVQEWLAGPPVNLDSERIQQATTAITDQLQSSGSQIAGGVFTGVTAVGSGLVTLALMLVLTFFFLKDGPAFLPWARRIAGRNVGRHLTEVLTRLWGALGGFIRAQAMVSAVDAFFIGLGLVVLGVPLAPALAILTFFGGFIPIVGAFAVGTLAVLVALVSNGLTTALLVLGVILLVQQVEGNVLQPYLQGRTMKLHAGIILLAVAAGSTILGIIGAFLAVPVAASVVVVLRYMSEQVDLRTGDVHVDELQLATSEGAWVASRGEQEAQHFVAQQSAQRRARQQSDEEARSPSGTRRRGPLARLKGLLRGKG